jgi:predicted  nucleic acid-binding Zn-ribbon protein
MSRRVKILEERYTNIRSKFQVTEQNMINKNKNFFSEIKTLNLEITEIKKEMNEIKDRMVSLLKELEAFAKKENVDILKKYIDLWNPVSFVTKNEIEAIVREVIDKMRREQ